MVKEFFRDWLEVTKNEADIANNAAIDAAQATEITNNTATNVVQSVDIANLRKLTADQDNIITDLTKKVADQDNIITDLTEKVAEHEKIMIPCIIVSAVAAIAITSFVAFCVYQGIKLDKPDTKFNDQDLGQKNDSSKQLSSM